MSGICGICEPGMEIPKGQLQSMMPILDSSTECAREIYSGRSIGFGVAQRWLGQESFACAEAAIAADTDLTNWREVSSYLEGRGLATREMSRGELLARLYLLDGVDFLKRLDGGFALALWDHKARRLLLAVDPLGLKTLYFAREHNRILFSTRSGAVRVAQQHAGGVNSSAVMQFLIFSAVTSPLSI